MKSDRRHELQTNELADWLGQRLEAFKPHATSITIGAAILLVAVLGSIWYFGGEDKASAKSWSQYFAAFNDREPGKALEKLAADQPGSTAALWALQSVGDMNVAQGAAMLFSDREEAKKLLEKAELAYKQVEAGATDPMLKARARLGLGKVYESRLKPDDARRYYEVVAESHKETAIGKEAAADVRRMNDQRQIALLAWFAKQEPKKPAPLSGLGGRTPGLPSDLPERPDISLPDGLGLDNIGVGSAAEPAPSFPSPGVPPPASSPTTPEGAKPGETKSENTKTDDAPPPATPPGDDQPN
jgi:hypothetical protein